MFFVLCILICVMCTCNYIDRYSCFTCCYTYTCYIKLLYSLCMISLYCSLPETGARLTCGRISLPLSLSLCVLFYMCVCLFEVGFMIFTCLMCLSASISISISVSISMSVSISVSVSDAMRRRLKT